MKRSGSENEFRWNGLDSRPMRMYRSWSRDRPGRNNYKIHMVWNKITRSSDWMDCNKGRYMKWSDCNKLMDEKEWNGSASNIWTRWDEKFSKSWTKRIDFEVPLVGTSLLEFQTQFNKIKQSSDWKEETSKCRWMWNKVGTVSGTKWLGFEMSRTRRFNKDWHGGSGEDVPPNSGSADESGSKSGKRTGNHPKAENNYDQRLRHCELRLNERLLFS